MLTYVIRVWIKLILLLNNLKKKKLFKLLTQYNESREFNFKWAKNLKREDTRYNSINESLYFRTKSLKEFKPLAEIFLDPKGKKIIPANIVDHLSYRSLAFWIMDDGVHVKRGGVTLCTDSYTSEEVSILKIALENKFNISTSIHIKKGKEKTLYERIYIGKSSLNEIKPLIKEHMHESILYKINEDSSPLLK